MTRRLYYDDAYTTAFRARVEEFEVRDHRLRVVLDQTFFYPTSGGQMHDTGFLAGLAVVDVEDEGQRIVHVLDGAVSPFRQGDEVEGRIDAERRMHHRQQHTGQHVLSRIVEDHLALPTISSRLGESMNTLDLETSTLTVEQLDEIEDLANAALWSGHEVRVHLLGDDEAAAWGLRKKVDRSGPVRVIEVESVDRCACGGTHVRHTAEVGEIVIVGTEKAKNLTRVHFLCGHRAHAWRRERHRWLDAVARDLTTGHPLVGETVRTVVEESKARQKRLAALARELVVARAEGWFAEARTVAIQSQTALLVARRLDEDESLASSEALHRVIARDGVLAALVLVEGDKGQLLLARSDDLGLDCRELLRDILDPIGGRGGGRPENARGGFPARDAERVLDALSRL